MLDWHHIPLLAPILHAAEDAVDVKRMRFTAQDVWSFVAAAITVSALYWGLANKLDAIAHANDQQIQVLRAQNADVIQRLEKLDARWQQHTDESSHMRERIRALEQEQADHEREDRKRFGR